MRFFNSPYILLVLVIMAIVAVEARISRKLPDDESVSNEDEDGTNIPKRKKKIFKIDEDSEEKTPVSKRRRKPIYKDSLEDDSDENQQKSKKGRKSSSRRARTWFANVPVSEEDNFCNILECGDTHIGCKYNTQQPEPPCAEESEYYDMEDYKDLIVKAHNKIRNMVAGGNVGDLKPAVRMATMKWDYGLHITATIKAKLCSMHGDNCHGTTKFPYSGQNIGKFAYGGPEDRYALEHIIKNKLENWFAENENCTRSIIKKFPQPSESRVGLFTIMVRDQSDHIGCGINHYKQNNMHHIVFICHYATNNFIGYPVYKTGTEPGSECKSGLNNVFPNLCSIYEKYDNNGIY